MSLQKYLDPRRYHKYVRRKLSLARYDLAQVQAEERRKFAEAGFDVSAGRERLDAILLEISGKRFDHVGDTDSVHWLLFACLSTSEWGRSVRDILEIGTFRGKTTLILSKLFPGAHVVTVDLPERDPILRNTYRRDDPAILAENRARRAANIAEARATLVEENSFFLPQVAPGPYDLIWVDGGHLYPEVAWDLCNAYHFCRPGGIVMCDDVFLHPKGGDGVYGNADSFNAIRYIAARAPMTVRYFLKRENPVWSSDARDRKYVAVLQKASGPEQI